MTSVIDAFEAECFNGKISAHTRFLEACLEGTPSMYICKTILPPLFVGYSPQSELESVDCRQTVLMGNPRLCSVSKLQNPASSSHAQ